MIGFLKRALLPTVHSYLLHDCPISMYRSCMVITLLLVCRRKMKLLRALVKRKQFLSEHLYRSCPESHFRVLSHIQVTDC